MRSNSESYRTAAVVNSRTRKGLRTPRKTVAISTVVQVKTRPVRVVEAKVIRGKTKRVPVLTPEIVHVRTRRVPVLTPEIVHVRTKPGGRHTVRKRS